MCGASLDDVALLAKRVDNWHVICLQEITSFSAPGVEAIGQQNLYHNAGSWRSTGILLHSSLGHLVKDWNSDSRTVWMDLALPDGMLRCISTHFPHSWTNEDTDFEITFNLFKGLALPGRGHILVGGDFNTPIYLFREVDVNPEVSAGVPLLGSNVPPHRFTSDITAER
eukprot:3044328-Amphidinium_carterae.2